MRKLTEQELDQIHTRLKSLYIRYTEVYEEIFDHYLSALEECSGTKSDEILQKLNKDFSRDTVIKMEKALRKASKKQVTKMQIESCKLWKLDNLSSLSFIIISFLSVLIAYFFGKYVLSAWVGTVIMTGLVFMFKQDKSLLRFNLSPWNRGTVGAVSQEIYGRFFILSGVGITALLNIQNIKLDRIYDLSDFFDIANLFLLVVLIYGLSLYRIFISRDFNTTTKLHSS